MKRVLLLVGLVLIVGGIAGVVVWRSPLFHSDPIVVALVRPARDSGGEAMVQGAQLCVDQINRRGGIVGRPVELLVLDDHNDNRKAINVATDIALESDALVVLGHYYSNTSLAAADIYQKNGVPAITASATDEHITLGNEWYFSVIPDNQIQAEFLAKYTKYILQQPIVNLIIDTDSYGTSLANNFSTAAREIGVSIGSKWRFKRASPDLNKTLNTIIANLRAMKNPGMLLFATQHREAVKILTSLKFPGTDYLIVGPDSFADHVFIEEFQKYTQEQVQPGYFSDGIYACTPFMFEFADERAHIFKTEFVRQYGRDPSWVAAYYYDAMQVAATAIEWAEIAGKKTTLQSDRRKIRQALERFDSYDTAIEGVTGPVYFNPAGSVERPYAIGIYQQQQLIPAFAQYQRIPPDEKGLYEMEETADGKFLQISDQTLRKLHIVYTGIDVNEVSHLDIKQGHYTAEFYVWFRVQEEQDEVFDDSSILFMDAAEPIELGEPIMAAANAQSITHTYRVKAAFETDFNFWRYPFDTQTMTIAFRHAHKPLKNLVYVPDLIGKSSASIGKNVGKRMFNAITGWDIRDFYWYHDMFTLQVGSSQTLLYFSRFNAELKMQRAGKSFIVKNFFPILVITIVGYFVYFLPADRFGLQVILILCVATAALAYHLKLLSRFVPDQQVLLIEYAFFTLYGLAAFSGLLTLAVRLQRKNRRAVALLRQTGRITYPVVVAGGSLLLAYMYFQNV